MSGSAGTTLRTGSVSALSSRMSKGGVGRMLVASLHQGIADLLPNRLEFYEGWLSPDGLRHGRIGFAPFAAALSFLRQEGDPYHLVSARAGEYAAEWTAAAQPASVRLLRALPRRLRLRLALRAARQMVRGTNGGSRVPVRWRRGCGTVDIYGSLFCEVRTPVDRPLCGYYAAAIRRLLSLHGLDVEVETGECRAAGSRCCTIVVRAPWGARRHERQAA